MAWVARRRAGRRIRLAISGAVAVTALTVGTAAAMPTNRVETQAPRQTRPDSSTDSSPAPPPPASCSTRAASPPSTSRTPAWEPRRSASTSWRDHRQVQRPRRRRKAAGPVTSTALPPFTLRRPSGTDRPRASSRVVDMLLSAPVALGGYGRRVEGPWEFVDSWGPSLRLGEGEPGRVSEVGFPGCGSGRRVEQAAAHCALRSHRPQHRDQHPAPIGRWLPVGPVR